MSPYPRIDELWPQGWRLKLLSTYVLNGTPFYAAVWKRSTENETRVDGWKYRDYKAKYDELWPQGWRLKLLCACVLNGTPLYSAVWNRKTEDEIRVEGWKYQDYKAKYDELWPQGWRPKCVTSYQDDPPVFPITIESHGVAALGGWASVTVNFDGSVRWAGSAHDSGADGYHYGLSVLVRPPSGPSIAQAHSGHVGGTFTSGSRDDPWDQTGNRNPLIVQHYLDYHDGHVDSNLEYSSDIGSALEAAVGWLLKFGAGTLLGTPSGAVVFVGLEIGSLISTGSLVPGARIAGGVLWMAGPGNTLFALVAEGIASLGSRTRELSGEEYNWANNVVDVFKGALPPRDRLVLTDTIGPTQRAFTFPRFDGKITLNLGPNAFDDPRRYPNHKYGEIFIHELVHACQIYHAKMDLVLLAGALTSKVCEATGGNPYAYGTAGFDFTSLGIEAQAQVIQDWFAGNVRSGSNQTGIPQDEHSPYFRYLLENIRIGRL